MIYCIWYPSGGFGHFINGILSLHGKDFLRPAGLNLTFSNNGNAHALDLIAPKYYHDPVNYVFEFDNQFNYSVLIDNGINNQSDLFKSVFPTACVIKICYTDQTWPIIARTMIDKAMDSSIIKELPIDADCWPTSEPWAVREKYFLFLRDHQLRHAWKPDQIDQELLIDDMLEYSQLFKKLCNFKIVLSDFHTLWNTWINANKKYHAPIFNAKLIINAVKNNINFSIDYINDVWEQAVIYYYIWIVYNFEVPHNDHADWFTNTKDIAIMLNKHGVLIDKN
jgi:hypothetical protein